MIRELQQFGNWARRWRVKLAKAVRAMKRFSSEIRRIRKVKRKRNKSTVPTALIHPYAHNLKESPGVCERPRQKQSDYG